MSDIGTERIIKQTIRIGSRSSNLALIQAESVKKLIEYLSPDTKCSIVKISTRGDEVLDRPLSGIGTSGVFVREIEKELLLGNIDIAVHSMKDMPGTVTDGLEFLDPPEAEDARDCLITGHNGISLEGATLGTGSPRRILQLKRLIKDLKTVTVRGNIETRIRKINDLGLSGVVLAAAGIKRAGYEDKITSFFTLDEVIPAPCQGILGLQVREGDSLKELLKRASHGGTLLRFKAERAFQKELGADCHSPVGANAEIRGDKVIFRACFGDADKEILITLKKEIPLSLGEDAVIKAAIEAAVKLREGVINAG